MTGRLKELLLRFLYVPAEPLAPAGAPESVRVFRAAKNFYYLNLIRWGIGQSITFFAVAFAFVLGFFLDLGPATVPVRIVKAVVLGLFLVQLPITYLFIRFDYEMRWYIVTDRSLRIRHGLLSVREMTMTYANIQQITIRQGPLQRLLQISDLEVQTAGGGSGGSVHPAGGRAHGNSMHLGYFKGVANAAEIRDLMLQRLRQFRDAGLGDPDEAHTPERPAELAGADSDLRMAARAVLNEAQALRMAIG